MAQNRLLRFATPLLVIAGGFFFISYYLFLRRRKKQSHDTLDGSGDIWCSNEEPCSATDGSSSSSKVDKASELSEKYHGDSDSCISYSTLPSSCSSAEIEDTLFSLNNDSTGCQGGKQNMTLQQARVLTALFSHPDDNLQRTAVTMIGQCAAFTRNQDTLREGGCLTRLVCMLRSHSMALHAGYTSMQPGVLSALTTTVNNLALNQQNQSQLKDCIPALIDFAVSDQSPEAVQLSTLQALTNLSVTAMYHGPYTCLIQQLYQFLDRNSAAIMRQSMKVLINLSCNADMVPHLLAAKGPACAQSLLVPTNSEDCILRWLTILANITETAQKNDLTYSSLPTDYKAASPETMYSTLYGVDNTVQLRSKVFVLTKHQNEEIHHQAARLYACLE